MCPKEHHTNTKKSVWKQFQYCKIIAERNYSILAATLKEQLGKILKDWAYNMRKGMITNVPGPVCKVVQGQLRGKNETDINGNPFFSFKGVPYAKPPIGKQRFKAPEPPEKWSGIREATDYGNPCFSLQMELTGLIPRLIMMGSEDCLSLNVFTHQLDEEESTLRPVMVWIHGGAFCTGSSHGDYCGPEHLMIEDIVLVTVNYRLGALGFLVIDDPSLEITGNAGLKDQLQALRWVQQNIKQFCGDPTNVTIFGQSAGSVSCHFLLLSPSSKGLFHKAILQSGTALCSFSRGINNAKQLAQKLGCTETSNEKILEFLQNVPVRKLVKAQHKIMGTSLAPGYKPFYGPTVEAKCKGALISQEPLAIMNSGTYNHIPLMIGYTSREGIIETFGGWCFYRKKLKRVFPFYYGLSPNSPEYKNMQKRIFQFYFGKNSPSCKKKDELHMMFTDVTFLRAIYLTTITHAKTSTSPLYYYRMSLDAQLNVYKKIVGAKKGVCHADDCAYLFKMKNVSFKRDSVEHLFVRRFVKLWTNFAKSGNPTPEDDSFLNIKWQPLTRTQIHFLDIDTSLVPGINPDSNRMKFWDELTKGIKENY